MKIKIRQETENDHAAVHKCIVEAFADVDESDHQEQFLVARLRKSSSFIPELSIIAEIEDQLVGHILFTKIKIVQSPYEFESLALAPVSVHPDYQGQGIGSELIKTGHKIAAKLGYKSIVVLGHATYYPKFSYTEAAEFDIKLPFIVPSENAMAIELVKNALKGVSGVVQYDPAFGI